LPSQNRRDGSPAVEKMMSARWNPVSPELLLTACAGVGSGVQVRETPLVTGRRWSKIFGALHFKARR
jgi:hypothetical protein